MIQALRESHFVEFLHKIDITSLTLFLISYFAVFWYIGQFLFGFFLLTGYVLLFLFYDAIQHKKFGKTIIYLLVTFLPLLLLFWLPPILGKPPEWSLLTTMVLLALLSIPQVVSAVRYRQITSLNTNSLSFFVVHLMSFFVGLFFVALYFSFLALFITPLIAPIKFSMLLFLVSIICFVFPFGYYTFFLHTIKRTVHEKYFNKAKIGKLNGIMHRLFQTDHAHPKKEERYILKLCTLGWIVMLVVVFICYMAISSIYMIDTMDKIDKNTDNIQIKEMVFEDEIINTIVGSFKDEYKKYQQAQDTNKRSLESFSKTHKRFFIFDNPNIILNHIRSHFHLSFKMFEYNSVSEKGKFLMLLSEQQRSDAYNGAGHMKDEVFRVTTEQRIEHGDIATDHLDMEKGFIFRRDGVSMLHLVGYIIEQNTELIMSLNTLGKEVQSYIVFDESSESELYYAQGSDNGYFYYTMQYAKIFNSRQYKICNDDDLCIFETASSFYMPELCKRGSPEAQKNCFTTFASRMGVEEVCEYLNEKFHPSEDFLEGCQDLYTEQETS